MKYEIVKKISINILFVTIFTACGDVKSDSSNTTNIVNCNSERSNAILVRSNQEIIGKTEDTKIVILHYQDNRKYVCTQTGEAVLETLKK